MFKTKCRSTRAKARCIYAAAAAALLSSASLNATTYTWTNGGADSNWSSAANWSGSIVPVSASTTDLVFNSIPVSPLQDIRSNFQVQSMKFGPFKYNLAGFSIAMSGSALVQCDASLSVTNDLDLLSNTTFAGAGAISLKGIVSDAGGVIKEGTGTLGFEAANTFAGTTSINAGQVIITNGAALQNSTVSINVNGGLNLFTVASATLGNLTGSGNWDLHGANVLIGNNNSSPLPYTGTITSTGTGGLQKIGTGTLILSGANSNSYDFAIQNGALVLRGGSMTLTSAGRAVDLRTSLTMDSGALLDTRSGSVVIDSPFSTPATFTLTGAATRWRANQISLGSGLASLVVDAGASITDALSISIGRTVSSATNPTPATLLIQGGGSMIVDTAKLGNNPNGSGLATVTGAGSLWTINTSLALGRVIQPGIGKVVVSNGGTVAVGGETNFITSGSYIEANGGMFSTGTLTGTSTIGDVRLTSSSSVLALTGATGTSIFSGAVSGIGNLVKSGASTHIFDGNLSYTGTTTVNGGTLNLVSGGSRTFIVNGGTLQVPYSDFGTRSFKANSGGTIVYQTNSISGGFLRGAGLHDLSAVTRIEGTSIGSDVSIEQSSPLTMINVTNAGTIKSSASLTLDGFFLTSAGQLSLNTDATIEAFESGGMLTINGESTVNNVGTNMVLGAGSRTFIGQAGREGGNLLLRDRTTLELNGALLVNNGTIDGPTDVNFGSLAKGSGRYGDVNVTDGGRFSPGNSPGTVTTGSTTWNSGGGYLVEIGDAISDSGHDFWLVDGELKLNASSQLPFTISLASLDGLIFDNTQDYTWPILQATDGITGFDRAALVLDTSAFKNPFAGHFFLESTATDLAVHYSFVPEPSSVFAFALFACVIRPRRRTLEVWRRET